MLTDHDYDRRVCITVVVLFIGLPLSLVKKIASLQFTGLLVVLFMCLLSVVLVVKAVIAGVARPPIQPQIASTTFVDFFNGLCIIAFTLSGQFAVFPVGARVE